jgi:hypothetical protein
MYHPFLLKSFVLFLFMNCCLMAAFSQEIIKGKVLAPDNKPLFGATIQVKGTSKITTTNMTESIASLPTRAMF